MRIPLSKKIDIINKVLQGPHGIQRLIYFANIAHRGDKRKALKSIKQCLRHVPDVLNIILVALKLNKKPKHNQLAKSCPWLKDSACEALWSCNDCHEWYDAQPWHRRALNHITHWFANSWEKVGW